jgi:hypothetical protein
LSVESKCVLLVIERMMMCSQLVRGEAIEASSEDFWSECLDKYHQSILDDFSIKLKLFGSSIKWQLEVLEDYLLSINTNKHVRNLHLPCVVVVSSCKFCDAISFNQGSGFDNWKSRFAIIRKRSRGRYF